MTRLNPPEPNPTAVPFVPATYRLRDALIEGSGGFTAVHDRRIRMQKGNVILTPTWNYHDHGKNSSGPLIWLDGLDLPNFRLLPVHFVEYFNEPRDAAKGLNHAASPIVFSWAK
ncbi:gentisate 1-2-dioxygenase [Penicillium canescens]|uniref:Gentisate 1-2-dioxygenase n=1 Tax=Penicillium canescens TaxID=5083 RepID=A0AAD6IC86_PENCN|nr:gentisate 1-2-dioxygenase [Penicillium canescens]KAJ6041635.1 gentisate 1-2-dioxygenase [Penicillium canescens]KAJ6050378.1 gentisate 1-2-dioxygenase [Penicillium canescens]